MAVNSIPDNKKRYSFFHILALVNSYTLIINPKISRVNLLPRPINQTKNEVYRPVQIIPLLLY
jgi:hypothetical protein